MNRSPLRTSPGAAVVSDPRRTRYASNTSDAAGRAAYAPTARSAVLRRPDPESRTPTRLWYDPGATENGSGSTGAAPPSCADTHGPRRGHPSRLSTAPALAPTLASALKTP